MVSLILTRDELNQIAKELSITPKYAGLYYSKQHPCLMYELNEITVAVQNKPELNAECKTIDYNKFNVPMWRQSVPDFIKHASKKRGGV